MQTRSMGNANGGCGSSEFTLICNLTVVDPAAFSRYSTYSVPKYTITRPEEGKPTFVCEVPMPDNGNIFVSDAVVCVNSTSCPIPDNLFMAQQGRRGHVRILLAADVILLMGEATTNTDVERIY
jgi:hypothetical protein